MLPLGEQLHNFADSCSGLPKTYFDISKCQKTTAVSRCSDDVMLIFLADKFIKVSKKTADILMIFFPSVYLAKKSLPGQNNFPILELPPCSLDPLSVYCSLLVLLAPEYIIRICK